MVSISSGTQTLKRAVWLDSGGDGIYVSSRIRLARNLAGFPFPHWASEEQRADVRDLVIAALTGIPGMQGGLAVRMDELPELERDILTEEHLVSKEFASGASGRALSLSRDDKIAVMVNEEDHIRLQYFSAGLSLREGWGVLQEMDSLLEKELSFAFSFKYGYLTACPTNVGTGLRVSVMMHLPGLQLTGEIEQVVKGLTRTGLQVRGLLGEGSEALGNMYQISNQMTLGVSEEETLEKVERLAEGVAGHERNARNRILQKKRTFVADRVARSVGVLKSCRMISSGEALGFLSGLSLGVECGMIRSFDRDRINELILLIQPAHLQRLHGSVVSDEKRDIIRAEFLRGRLKNVRFTG